MARNSLTRHRHTHTHTQSCKAHTCMLVRPVKGKQSHCIDQSSLGSPECVRPMPWKSGSIKLCQAPMGWVCVCVCVCVHMCVWTWCVRIRLKREENTKHSFLFPSPHYSYWELWFIFQVRQCNMNLTVTTQRQTNTVPSDTRSMRRATLRHITAE